MFLSLNEGSHIADGTKGALQFSIAVKDRNTVYHIPLQLVRVMEHRVHVAEVGDGFAEIGLRVVQFTRNISIFVNEEGE